MQSDHAERFPWAYEHILDDAVPGSPPWEGRVVAEYWQVRWARLNGESTESEPIIYTFPQDGAWAHETDASMVESRLTLVYSRGLVDTLVIPDFFLVTDTAGNEYSVTPRVFYGYGSHVVHLSSETGWPANTDFTVTALAGVPFIDGSYSAEEYSFSFSTREPSSAEEAGPPALSCGCSTSTTPSTGALMVALLAMWRRGRTKAA
jgi:MYXO-CTERM domain-containing protein